MNPFEKYKDLIIEQKLAVLSTCGNDGQPYTSLVAFAAADDLQHIWFATKRQTRKFQNILSNPKVSLLIENTKKSDSDFKNASAVTILGKAKEVEKQELLSKLENSCSILKNFANEPDSALLCVEIEKVYLVDNFQNVSEIDINDNFH